MARRAVADCDSEVSPSAPFCRSCYFRLPEDLRRVYRFWLPRRFDLGRGQRSFERVRQTCLTWFREHPGGGGVNGREDGGV